MDCALQVNCYDIINCSHMTNETTNPVIPVWEKYIEHILVNNLNKREIAGGWF